MPRGTVYDCKTRQFVKRKPANQEIDELAQTEQAKTFVGLLNEYFRPDDEIVLILRAARQAGLV